MDRRKAQMLEELQALQFAIVDLHLYLDTHPCDKRALEHYNALVCKMKEVKERYEQFYGPITPDQPSKFPWQWIEGPWPWEMIY
ncbi:MAG TPA: spore coat protein CotJB [Clostridia bacterium]|jgi:spore coat protein JB|nr:spore coat protein CotJB [Clostridia bacterium]